MFAGALDCFRGVLFCEVIQPARPAFSGSVTDQPDLAAGLPQEIFAGRFGALAIVANGFIINWKDRLISQFRREKGRLLLMI
ncbi:hypothetical protein JKG47_00370 [Acidithiobacillus sp. MC6.1]|nr:hypothetical protein [Acidithiobacillus sp. MC6.1]